MVIGAVFIAAGLGAFGVLSLVFADQLTPARAESLLQKSSPELTAVLQHQFTSDFNRIVKATVESKQELKGDEAVASFLDDQTRPIADRFGTSARQAPPELVVAWMIKRAETMEAVNDIAGPDICTQYAQSGTSALTDPQMVAELAPVFDARDAAFFAALAGARDNPLPETVGEATDQDWAAVETAMTGLEVPAGYAQIVKTDDTQSSDYCAALAYYFRILADLPDSSGERIRAEYFVRSFS